MKKLLFNLEATQPIGNTKYHGGGIYGLIVFKKLVSIDPTCLSVYYNTEEFLDEEVLNIINNNNIKTYDASKVGMYDAARKEGGIIYSPVFNSTYTELPPKDIFMLVTQHGLRALEMPDDVYRKYIIDTSISKLHRILRRIRHNLIPLKFKTYEKRQKFFSRENIKFITVSEHSKFSITTFYPQIRPDSIKVWYSPSTINHTLMLDNYVNQYEKYFLIVSANRWLKNGLRAIIAFDQLFSERPDFIGSVVITGIKDWSEVAIKIKNKNRFKLIGYVDELQLKGLYHYARFLCYPTLNEGFGYPPLEAMFEGTPVIASAIASVTEVCGDSVLYFNPYSISEIKTRILQMDDEHFNNKYRLLGKKRQLYIENKQNSDLEDLCKFLLSYVL